MNPLSSVRRTLKLFNNNNNTNNTNKGSYQTQAPPVSNLKNQNNFYDTMAGTISPPVVTDHISSTAVPDLNAGTPVPAAAAAATAAATSIATSAAERGTFTLLLFAAAESYTSHDQLTLPAPTTLPQLFDLLEQRWPGIKRKVLRSAAVTVNLEYVEFEVDEAGDILGRKEDGVGGDGGDGGGEEVVKIVAGDEVGIVPPVSSG